MLIPSVTVVCDEFHPLSQFARNEVAADRGRLVHLLCTQRAILAPEEWDAVPDHVRGYVDAFMEWRDLYRPRFLAEACDTHFTSETLGVHGTPDLVAEFEGSGVGVIDMKSGFAPPYVDMQVAAYRRILCAQFGKVDFGAWLVLKPNGASKYHVMDEIEDANGATDFFAAVRLYRRINRKKLNGNGG